MVQHSLIEHANLLGHLLVGLLLLRKHGDNLLVKRRQVSSLLCQLRVNDALLLLQNLVDVAKADLKLDKRLLHCQIDVEGLKRIGFFHFIAGGGGDSDARLRLPLGRDVGDDRVLTRVSYRLIGGLSLLRLHGLLGQGSGDVFLDLS